MDPEIRKLNEKLDSISEKLDALRKEQKLRDEKIIRLLSQLYSMDIRRQINLLERERTEILVLIQRVKTRKIIDPNPFIGKKDLLTSDSPKIFQNPSEKSINLFLSDQLNSNVGRSKNTLDPAIFFGFFIACLVIVGLILRLAGSYVGVIWTAEMNVAYGLMAVIFSAAIALYVSAAIN